MTPLVSLLIALVAGAVVGSAGVVLPEHCAELGVLGGGLLIVAARLAWAAHARPATASSLIGMLALGTGLGGVADHRAWQPPGLDLAALERAVSAGQLVHLAGRARRDAALSAAGQVVLDLEVDEVQVAERRVPTRVGARVTIAGAQAPRLLHTWTRGRQVRVAASTVRRPLPYRNFGVPDTERELARRGLRVFVTVKSAALTDTRPAAPWEEWAARARARVRATVRAHVADPADAAIVTAILIGDRSQMAAETSRALQHAGVYHVVAISGGNVALWLAVVLVVPRAAGLGVRTAAGWMLVSLLAAAAIVDGGASVERAVAVAVLAIAVRWWDLRAPPGQVLALAGLSLVLLRPLVLHDPGMLLSFGAAATLVGLAGPACAAPPARRSWRWATRALGMAVVATLAVEAVLLPVAARWFGVATAAGVLANLVAVPAMAIVQAAGLSILALATIWAPLGSLAGEVATFGVQALLRSAEIVRVAPWMVREVPPPTSVVLLVYYASLLVLARRLLRRGTEERTAGAALLAASPGLPARRPWLPCDPCPAIAGAAWVGALAWILTGGPDTSAPAPWKWPDAARWQRAAWPREPWLLVTVLDVGQGDASVIRLPSGVTWVVDTGGSVSEAFDVGERVTTPALWALGHRSVARVVVTHAHPDHANGLAAVLRRFPPRELLTGVPVHDGGAAAAVAEAAAAAGLPERRLAAGERLAPGPVSLSVLHPERPDWERRRVRNDDSVVIWLRMGDVGVLLPGDVSQEVEQRVSRRLAAAPLTVVRLAHHGSASSTSRALLDALRPVLAVGSLGRGNRFGHPAPSVVRRLADAGTVLLRTDQHGAVQLATNGRVLLVRTAVGQAGSITAATARHAWWPATPSPSAPGSPSPVPGPVLPGAPRRTGTGG